jgi:hypothetical protein
MAAPKQQQLNVQLQKQQQKGSMIHVDYAPARGKKMSCKGNCGGEITRGDLRVREVHTFFISFSLSHLFIHHMQFKPLQQILTIQTTI